MRNLMLSWQVAAGAGAAAFVLGSAVARRASCAATEGARGPGPAPLARPSGSLGALLREAGLMLLLFALWEFAGQWSLGRGEDAVARGQAIWDAERWLRLPSERGLQTALLPQHWLIQGANYYYAVMHFGVMIGFLLWVFLRHRAAYPRVRALLVVVTGAALLVQLLPVAPPRLVPGTGMVDTGLAYGQSVYAGAGAAGVTADGLAAMPSVHVAWCLLVAACAVSVSRSRWRWLVWPHVALTVLVVVVTANHYWLDGVAGAVLVAAAWPVGSLVERRAAQRRTCGRSSSSQ